MAQINDTIKLHMYFEDENGNAIPVTDVKLNFYDNKRVVLQPEVDITDEHYVGIGHYVYDYLVPAGTGNITVEFKGQFAGKQYLHREDMIREWTKTTGGTSFI